MLFVRTKTEYEDFWGDTLSNYKMTLKQQLNGEKMRYTTKTVK